MGKLKSLVSSNDRVNSVDTKLELFLNNQLKLLSVSKSVYYYTPISKFSSNDDIKLLNAIDLIHTKHPYYGTRSLVKLLNRLGFLVGRKLIKSAMEFMGIKALYPKKKTTVINKQHKKYPYLLNVFKNETNQVVIDKANKVWSADITYIRLECGYAYLAAIIDWHSKKILAWKISNTMDTHLTTSVLKEALFKYGKPDIFNSDQGTQYTAKEHIKILSDNKINISMDAKGRSIDNIAIERFWKTLKYENVYPASYITMKEAKVGIKEYIDIYNNERLHSSIGYMTPDEVYSGILDAA
ncbi:transposase [Francisella halioticida]|nr:transposase [Francisella halioticida]